MRSMRKIIHRVCRKFPRVFVIVGTIAFATAGFLVSYQISVCLSFARRTCLQTGECVAGVAGLLGYICLLLCLLRGDCEEK